MALVFTPAVGCTERSRNTVVPARSDVVAIHRPVLDAREVHLALDLGRELTRDRAADADRLTEHVRHVALPATRDACSARVRANHLVCGLSGLRLGDLGGLPDRSSAGDVLLNLHVGEGLTPPAGAALLARVRSAAVAALVLRTVLAGKGRYTDRRFWVAVLCGLRLTSNSFLFVPRGYLPWGDPLCINWERHRSYFIAGSPQKLRKVSGDRHLHSGMM